MKEINLELSGEPLHQVTQQKYFMHIKIKKDLFNRRYCLQARTNISKKQLRIIQCRFLRMTQNEGS